MFTLKYKDWEFVFTENHVNMLSTFVIIVCGLFLFFKLTIPAALPIAFFLTSLIFHVGGRPSFIVALLALIMTMFFVAFKKDLLAENAAIAVYYMLLSGTILELVSDKIHTLYTKITKKLHA